jgi:hypothetical protein
MNLEELLSTLESPIVIRPTRRMTQGELENYLDKAADILRGNADHSEFRGYVFGSSLFCMTVSPGLTTRAALAKPSKARSWESSGSTGLATIALSPASRTALCASSLCASATARRCTGNDRIQSTK